MWLAESDSLDMKLALAARCGDGARHFALLRDRLAALGVDLAAFDARFGGYSKLFAFFRSLQTTEERAAAGAVTLRAYNIDRLDLHGQPLRGQGRPRDRRAVPRETLVRDEQNHRDVGRRMLLDTAINEESQARARRVRLPHHRAPGRAPGPLAAAQVPHPLAEEVAPGRFAVAAHYGRSRLVARGWGEGSRPRSSASVRLGMRSAGAGDPATENSRVREPSPQPLRSVQSLPAFANFARLVTAHPSPFRTDRRT